MLAMQVDDWLRDEKAIEAAVDSWIAVRLTPKVDTNALGLRRISMDLIGEISQARDCAGHPEWILQAGALRSPSRNCRVALFFRAGSIRPVRRGSRDSSAGDGSGTSPGLFQHPAAGELALLSGLLPIQHGRNVLMLREQACCQARCEGWPATAGRRGRPARPGPGW